MLQALTHIGRFLTIARILARHDALFSLEYLKVAPAYVALARLLSKRNVEGRPGQRLARALDLKILDQRHRIAISEQIADRVAHFHNVIRRLLGREFGRKHPFTARLVIDVIFVAAHPAAPINSRPISIRRISFVPAPMSSSFASRIYRSTGQSVV